MQFFTGVPARVFLTVLRRDGMTLGFVDFVGAHSSGKGGGRVEADRAQVHSYGVHVVFWQERLQARLVA